jgi:O-antigen/teichoic acid export membrane protein
MAMWLAAAEGPWHRLAMSMSGGTTAAGGATVGAPGADGRARLLRNAGWLMIAQVVAAPLSIAVNAVMGRTLGPADFGLAFLALNVCTFAFLVVDFGQSTVLPGMVARHRERAGPLLGSSVAWKGAGGVVAVLAIAAGARVVGCSPELFRALLISAVASALWVVGRTFVDAVRGLERTDVAAGGIVLQQVLAALLVIPVLLAGGGLDGALGAQALAGALALVTAWIVARALGFRGLSVRRGELAALAREGGPFLVLGLAITLQPNIDVVLLAHLAPPQVVGWHGAAMKLVGALVFPATSLVTALYPTLFRLHAVDPAAFVATTRTALRTAALLVLPVVLGCALFPEVGTSIFGRAGFSPSEDNLRLLAPYLFLLYFSMTLGSCASAAGKQRPWALVQVGCLALSATLDLLLIPLFQRTHGNGGLGVCVSLVCCEVAMVGAAVWLSPGGLFDRSLLRGLGRTALAGAAMAAAALALSALGPVVAVPGAGLAYLAALWAMGGSEREQLRGMARKVLRRLGRAG